MTERKPREISFTSWIDRQINEAQERGDFDNLPGAGKPLPRGALSADAWLRNYLDREGVSAEAMLPVPLRLRKEAERLPDTLGELRTEQDVREVVRDLNRRILSGAGFPGGRRSSCDWWTRTTWWPGGGIRGPGQPLRPRPDRSPRRRRVRPPRGAGGAAAATAGVTPVTA